MNIGQRILTLLKSRGMSQKALSKATGLTTSYINQICLDKRLPTFDTLEKICDSLGLSLDAFFSAGNDSLVLTPQEQRLVACYRQLPSSACDPILNLVCALSDSGKSSGTPGLSQGGTISGPTEYLNADRYLIARMLDASMEPLLFDGDFIVASRTQAVGQGDTVLVCLNAPCEGPSYMIRICQHAGDVLELRPANARFPSRVLSRGDVRGIYKIVHVMAG